MRRRHVLGSLMLIAISWVPVAVALEDCNMSPKDGRDITEALQCLDRNIRSLALQPGGGAAGPAKSESPMGRYIAGAYTTPDGRGKFQLTGPMKIGTREKWLLAADTGYFQATWITGPPKGHPMLLKNKLVDELPDVYDYGLIGKSVNLQDGMYTVGQLFGATPTPDGIIISRLHEGYTDVVVEKSSFPLRLSKDRR